MQQHSLKSPEGSKKNRKRVGRGDSSGSGSYSGKGMKGQKSRSGGGVRPGFEGGQLPLIKKLSALRGFNNIFRREFIPINLSTISKLYEKDSQISPETLVDKNVLKNTNSPIKILGEGEINFSVNVTAHKFSRSAKDKIIAAGGTVQEIE
ncbi:MAG: 50S ribosomal protein L15 [SAR202 cluster bacterium]|nr:50S ribosomal protein L15 [SAR202 cluster bacterium]|tara:strand:+ start:4740 stop:5189 length:450 start_codon:yes stop_codon:yes gene_type:complete